MANESGFREWRTRGSRRRTPPALALPRRRQIFAELPRISEAHDGTPTRVHLDAQGRAFLTEEDDGTSSLQTRLVLDVAGNVREVEDARGNVAETRIFGMVQQVLHTDAEDAGWRLGLADVTGAAVRGWNERGFASRVGYDALRRPTHAHVTPPSASEIVVARTVWGESLPSPTATNHRGRPYRVLRRRRSRTSFRTTCPESRSQSQRRSSRTQRTCFSTW